MSEWELNRRKYVTSGTAALASFGLAGCSGDDGDNTTPEGTSAGGKKTLELWHDKGQNPNWNPAFDASLKAANEQLESYSIEHVPYQSLDSYGGAIRPVFGTEDAPALGSWWCGQQLRDITEQGYTRDISHVWDEHMDAYSERQRAAYTYDGKTAGVPTLNSYYAIWYNSETLNELGLEAPDTWQEFKQLCSDIISESDGDTSPIMIPLGPTWTAQLWFEEFVMRQDPEFYNNLCDGEAAYTDDTSIEALSIMKEFGEKGYWGEVNKANSLSLDDMPRSMEQGDYAMTLTPSWLAGLWESQDLDFSKYEWFHLPVINSEVEKQMIWEPAPIFFHSGYSDKEALDAAADVLLSEEYQQKWSSVQGFIPANQNVDSSYLTDEMSGLWESVQNNEFTIQLRMLENTSWQVIGPGAKVLKRAFKPDADIQDIAQKLDDLRTEVYG